MEPLPPCLSIQQPWAWLILHAGKDVENRKWRTAYRGLVFIHAPAKFDADAHDLLRQARATHPARIVAHFPKDDDLVRSALVGIVEIVDCVRESDSSWFRGPYGFVLRNARPIATIPCPGRLGLFPVPTVALDAARSIVAN